MKTFINEARKKVERTIDPKLWGAAYHIVKKPGADLENEKPKKADDLEAIKQKYVASLLIAKLNCPTNMSEFLKGPLHLFALKYNELGGDLEDIQKLFVENGGVLSTPVNNDTVDFDDQLDNEENFDDYSDKEDFDDKLKSNEIDDFEEEQEDPKEIRNIDVQTHQPEDNLHKEFEEDVLDNEKSAPKESYKDYIISETGIVKYLKKFAKTLFRIKVGQGLYFDEEEGLNINEKGEKIAECVITPMQSFDNKARFMALDDITNVRLGNVGNNGVYDEFYYIVKKQYNGTFLFVPGSNYYEAEITKGPFYTNMLADNNNLAAKVCQNYKTSCNFLNNMWYLPTAPEMSRAICNGLDAEGVYWTSSVGSEGDTNIAIKIGSARLLEVDDPSFKATAVPFIKF